MEGSADKGEFSAASSGESERRAIVALRALRADRAPERLRAQIEGMRASGWRSRVRSRGRPRERTRPRVLLGALSGALAAALIAVALLLPSGAPGSPSVSQAALLAGRGPVLAAPGFDPVYPGTRLERRVGSMYFPNWQRLGWQATGQRIDRLGLHTAITVFYRHDGRSIAYTILTGSALPWPGTSARLVAGTRFEMLALGQREVVTWRRYGHTCVLSGIGTSPTRLSALAAWGNAVVSDLPRAQGSS